MDDGWDDLDDWAEDACKSAVVEEQKHLVNTFMEHVTQPTDYERHEEGKTPVLSGKLMANTHVTVNRASNASLDIEDEDGTDTRVKAALMVGSAPAYSKVYIQNNVKDEDGNRYSIRADYKGWAKSKPYRFFTRSWEKTKLEMEDRNR